MMTQGLISVRKHVARILTLVQVHVTAPLVYCFRLILPSFAAHVRHRGFWIPLL